LFCFPASAYVDILELYSVATRRSSDLLQLNHISGLFQLINSLKQATNQGFCLIRLILIFFNRKMRMRRIKPLYSVVLLLSSIWHILTYVSVAKTRMTYCTTCLSKCRSIGCAW